MAHTKLTIKEIAKMAGVSPASVSFALNGRAGVSAATKEKIMSVIKEMDYCPSMASQRLVLQKSFNIAFIYPAEMSPFTDLFYYEVANGLTEELTRSQYNVVFAPLMDEGGADETPNIIKRRDADGAIFLHGAPKPLLEKFDKTRIPYVLVDWQPEGNEHTNISLDCERSIYSAVMYLAGKGHTKIAFLGSDRLPFYYLRCFTGYQNALFDAQLPIYPGWIHNSVHDVASAVKSLEKLISSQAPPTAVCCMSDMCAVESIQAAAELGIRVPDQLSFISIDDILLSRHIRPQLTTISYEKNGIGKTAARLLLKMINGESVESVVIQSETVIERQTVADRRITGV